MKPIRFLFILLLAGLPTGLLAQLNLEYQNNITPTYDEVIEMYKKLDAKYEEARLIKAGDTDSGKPLHLFVISKDQMFIAPQARMSGKTIMMVNNGIHPGECNGIDASLDFANRLLSNQSEYSEYLDNTILIIVPVFNIGGALNRSEYNRANQNGPKEHGFRGNAKNLDLNRDFVKKDSENARSLVWLFHSWDPDVFVDTHSTNGADYPYTVTLIPSHHQQLEKPQADFLKNKMEPALFEAMNSSPYKMSHYVNVYNQSPENGFEGFYQYPRYLAGYTSYFQTLSFTIETHMLKPYEERVLSTRFLLGEILKFTSTHRREIKANKIHAINLTSNKEQHVIKYKNDTSRYDMIEFTGYEAKKKKSKVTGQEMIYYDRDKTWTKEIQFYNYFDPETVVTTPEYYLIPAAWKEIENLLNNSKVNMIKLSHDREIEVEAYYIKDYQTTDEPYNGHYWHYNTEVIKKTEKIQFYEGDTFIPVTQRAGSYIVQTLEPHAYDSYFSWNFFDPILSRKEYFSPYLFDETAYELLKSDKELKKEFETRKQEDPEFRSNSYLQLRWIYERSPWSEPTYRRYPIYRVMQ